MVEPSEIHEDDASLDTSTSDDEDEDEYEDECLDEEEDEIAKACFCTKASWPNYRLCSQHGWCLFWAPLLLYAVWHVYFRLILTSSDAVAPFMAVGLFLLGIASACFMPRPGKNVWFLCLPCLWGSVTFPGSYSYLWAWLAPLPSQSHHRTCSPSELFGSTGSITEFWPRLASHTPYYRGECADPVCGFVYRIPDDLNLPSKRRPVFLTRSVEISNSDELPPACRQIARSGTVNPNDQGDCSEYCHNWLEPDQRWRFVVHFFVPYCSFVAGWGERGGGSVYLACGKSAVALLHLGHWAVMFSLAALYSLPLLFVLARETRIYRRARPDPSADNNSPVEAMGRVGGPSQTACMPDGRFSTGKLYFPYSFVSVNSDAQGERICTFLESIWVVPDVPSDLLTCLIYLRTGCAHRALAVLATLFLVCDPLQLKGAKAMLSRWQVGFPSRLWWEYRGKQGIGESGLSAALAFYSLASAQPYPAVPVLLHTMTLGFSAGTSLLAVSAGAEAHALVHLADHAALDLRDYYGVMRVRRRLGPVRMAAMLRVVSSAWAAAVAETVGRLEMAAMNLCCVFLETLAREWDSHQRTMRLSLVAQACRYICLGITMFAVISKGYIAWDDFYEDITRGYSFQDLVAFAISLSKAGCMFFAGPLALLASPAADVMGHRAFSHVRVCVGSRLDLMGADSVASYTSGSRLNGSLGDPSLGGTPLHDSELGEAFEHVDDSIAEGPIDRTSPTPDATARSASAAKGSFFL